MSWSVVLLVSGVCSLIAFLAAPDRGRNERTWAILAFVFGVFALLALFVMPTLPKDTKTAEDWSPPVFGNGG